MQPIEPASPADSYPGKLPFALQEGERVIARIRRHPVFLWSKLVGLVIAAIVPPTALLLLVSATAGLDGIVGVGVVVVAAAWLVYWLVRIYFTWYRYNNDVWVLTNQRLVDSIRRHWFHHQMASADLINVEDISVQREGVLQTVFNFGSVRVQTSGEQPNFILTGIPDPARTLAIVDAARDNARREFAGKPLL